MGDQSKEKTITLAKTDAALMSLGLKKLTQNDWNNMLKLHRFGTPMDRDRVLSVNLDDFFFIVGSSCSWSCSGWVVNTIKGVCMMGHC